MERVNQFIYGNEVSLPLSSVKIGELYFLFEDSKITVYKKTVNKNVKIKTVNDYGELYLVKGINNEPPTRNYIILNP